MKIIHNGILYETYEIPVFAKEDLLEVAFDLGVSDISKANLLLEAILKDDEEENPDENVDASTTPEVTAEADPKDVADEVPKEESTPDTTEEPPVETPVKEEPKEAPVVNNGPWLQNKSLRTLYNNYFKLWPDRKGSSNHFNMRVVPNDCLYLEAKTKQCKVNALVQSELDNPQQWYDCTIVIRRKNLTDLWSVDAPCEVKCTCKSFKYYLAYPNVKNKSFYSRPSGENKIPNDPFGKNNPRQIPALCKHLAAMTQKMMEEGKLAS